MATPANEAAVGARGTGLELLEAGRGRAGARDGLAAGRAATLRRGGVRFGAGTAGRTGSGVGDRGGL